MNVDHDAKFGIMKNYIIYCDLKHLFHKHWMLDKKKLELSLLIFEILTPKLHIPKNYENKTLIGILK
jgi:hypothetical protein